MKKTATKSRKKTQKTDSDPEPSFLCLFVLFVAKKLSSVKIFAPHKEIDRLYYGWTGETGSTTDADSSLILCILSIRVLPSRRNIVDTLRSPGKSVVTSF